MTRSIKYYFLIACSLTGFTFSAHSQSSARDFRGPAPVVQLASEPAPKLVVDPPLPEPLALGRVVIQYRAENLRIVPVFGAAALDISPRIGHIHVTVDDAPWHWADAGNEPLIINGLTAGPHRVLVELADPTHKVIERKTVSFVIPAQKGTSASHGADHHSEGNAPESAQVVPETSTPTAKAPALLTARDVRGPAAVVPLVSEPAPKLVVDPPLPDQLALGRVIVQYRTENLRIVPVFGTAALDVSPRIGHIHVTIDGGPWRWADASNEPVIIVGMKAGQHSMLIELVNPAHKVVDHQTLTFTVPEVKKGDMSHH